MGKILIIAHEFRHAEYYTREVLHIPRSAWKFIFNQWDLQPYVECEVILIEAPRHKPTLRQLENRCLLNEVCSARRIEVKRVILP